MRILLVNSNTSQFVTDKIAAEARVSASPGTEIVAVTGTFGARVINTRTENAIATHAMVALMAKHHPGCDAAVIGVSYDTGLGAAREMLPIPVVGMTEAALLTACMLGGQIGIVTFGKRVMPAYKELVHHYHLSGRIAGWRTVESPAVYTPADQTESERLIVAAANALVDEDHAETVILAGAVMAGVPRRLQPQVPVPLIDGIACGIRQAELLVRLGLPKPKVGSYAPLPPRELIGVDDAIAALFKAKA